MIFFMLLALIGFVASVVVHAASWGQQPLGINQTWPLHVGIFVVFIPMVLGQKRQPGPTGKRRIQRTSNFPEAPEWMNLLINIFGLYAIINLLVGVILLIGFTPDLHQRNGRYVVEKNRTFIREATPGEVRVYRARGARVFSGHWMVFYWASLTGLVDARRRATIEQAERDRAFVPTGRYMHTPPMLSLWTHSTMLTLATFVCFFGVPLVVCIGLAMLIRRYVGPATILNIFPVLLLPLSALVALRIPPRVMRRIPARCPLCDGRAYYEGGVIGGSNTPLPYRCKDCGEITDASDN